MTPREYCRAKVGRRGSSIYYGARFLSPREREAIMAVYAFCHEVDDTVDKCSDPDVARAKLEWWRQEIANTFAGRAQHPVGRALEPVIDAFRLPADHFDEILNGMRMDIGPVRYARFDELRLYCYRAASVVVLLSARILGYANPATDEYARDLGIAVQLTKIIRDVGEDARRDRVYLPAEDLQRFGVTRQDILAGRHSENLVALMEFEAARAAAYRQRALARLPHEDRGHQLPGIIMAEIDRATLDEIRADGFRVLRHKILLPPHRQWWLAWTTRRREHRRLEARHA